MTDNAGPQGVFGAMLDRFVRDVHGVLHALLISGDGFRLASSAQLDEMVSTQLAAMCSSYLSLTRQMSMAAAHNKAAPVDLGDCDYVLVRLEAGFLVLKDIGTDAGLVVIAGAGCDLGVVGSETTRFVESVGHALSPAVRAELLPVLSASRHGQG